MNNLLKPENLSHLELNDELLAYKSLLEKSVKENSSWPIFNEGKAHAAILMATIFSCAEKYVYLYCNALNPQLSSIDIYYDALEKCVQRGVPVQLALQSQDALNVDNPAIKLVQSSDINKVVVLSDELDCSLRNKLNNMDIHFAVSDDKRYRMEYDKTNMKAISSFNDKKITLILKQAIETVF
jgi:phosphatidylserine/phosphatidylglycerophosphate/cardiolipin synthase-like enzyme